jgi:hypothetical protein
MLERALKTVFDTGYVRERLHVLPFPFPCADIGMRRTATDRREPRSVVTAALMGDPKPGRSAQDAIDRRAIGGALNAVLERRGVGRPRHSTFW